MRMDRFPVLNLPNVKLRASRRGDCDYVWDGLRGCWLLLTPEEWVRRHVIEWLISEINVAAVDIIQEYQVVLGGASQRADIVVRGVTGQYAMLVECKAADVAIDATALNQAIRYNSVVGARYVMITNGVNHYFYVTWNGCDYSRLERVPDLASL